jgi:ABC-type nitrate/sulfonate/bicarbonate transport system permease component
VTATASVIRSLGRPGRWLLGLLPIALVGLAWQLLGNDDSPFFPPPSHWFEFLEAGGWSPLAGALRTTAVTVAAGLATAAVAGTALGLGIGRSRVLRQALSPTLEFLRAIPAPALVPLVILFVGQNGRAQVLSVTLAAVWPVLLNSVDAAQRIEPLLLDSGRSLGLTKARILRTIIVPATLPGAFVGIRVALPIALVVTLLVEMLTGTAGLGGMLMSAQRSYDTATAYGLLVVAGLLGLALSLLFGWLQHRIFRSWRQPASR